MDKYRYGNLYSSHLLKQWILYVQMADKISERRAQTNRFYISLLSGLLALLTFLTKPSQFESLQNIVVLCFSILGLLLSLVWFFNIQSYRQLNSGKFKVIHEMESELPFPCFDREWKLMDEGGNPKKYFQLTRIEQFIPALLGLPYLVLLLWFLYSFFYGEI